MNRYYYNANCGDDEFVVTRVNDEVQIFTVQRDQSVEQLRYQTCYWQSGLLIVEQESQTWKLRITQQEEYVKNRPSSFTAFFECVRSEVGIRNNEVQITSLSSSQPVTLKIRGIEQRINQISINFHRFEFENFNSQNLLYSQLLVEQQLYAQLASSATAGSLASRASVPEARTDSLERSDLHTARDEPESLQEGDLLQSGAHLAALQAAEHSPQSDIFRYTVKRINSMLSSDSLKQSFAQREDGAPDGESSQAADNLQRPRRLNKKLVNLQLFSQEYTVLNEKEEIVQFELSLHNELLTCTVVKHCEKKNDLVLQIGYLRKLSHKLGKIILIIQCKEIAIKFTCEKLFARQFIETYRYYQMKKKLRYVE